MVRLKLLNDNSYRSNDSKKIIDFSLKKQVNNQNFFDINYRGSEKEMPGSIYQPLNKEKHTTIFSSNISFSEHDFTTTIIGAYNCLEDLEEKRAYLPFRNIMRNLTLLLKLVMMILLKREIKYSDYQVYTK